MAAGEAPGAGQLIGRARELRSLTEAWATARDGRSRLVVVSGEAGVGKTWLCEQAAGAARDAGLAVAWGSCWPDGGAPALWPWHTLLGELCGPAATALLDGDSGVAGVSPERFSRFAAVAERLGAAAARRPALIVIDDMHAADPGTLLLTRFVARTQRQRPLTLVVCIRSSRAGEQVVDDLLADLEDEATLVALGGLGLEDTAAFLRASGDGSPDAALVQAVHRVTAGNPLYLRRLVALGRRRASTDVLPVGIRTVIAEAAEHLGADARSILCTGAVLGLAPTVADTVAVTGAPTASVLAALDEGAALGLVALRDGDRFTFGHELVREALEASLTAAERLDAHHRAAVALARPGTHRPERLARVAHHALCAARRSPEDASRAIDACRAAARDMTRRFSYEGAAELLARAAAEHDEIGHGPAPAALLVEWSEAVLACGRLAEARVLFDRAVVDAHAAGDAVLVARAALGLGGVWVGQHRTRLEREKVLGWQRRALAALPDAEAALRARLTVRLAAEAAYPGGPPDDVLDALADARRLGDDMALAEALSLTHHVLLAPAHTATRLRLAEELVRVASAAEVGPLGLLGLCWRAVDLFHLGDPRAERALIEARARSDAVGCQSVLYVAEVMGVMLLLRQGRLEEAEKQAAACYELGCDVGDADALGYLGAHLLAIAWLQGRSADVLPMVSEIAASPSLVSGDFTYQATLAALAAEAGDHQRARAVIAEIAAGGLDALPRSSSWLAGMLSIVEAAVALHDTVLAREAYRLLEPFADQPIMPSLAVVCLGSTERPLGLAAMAFGELDAAVGHFQRAVSANQALGNRPLTAISRADLATALVRRDRDDDRRRAAELFDAAATEARDLSLAARAETWESARQRLRDRPDDRHTGEFHREGAHWVVAVGGRRALVPDRVGMAYLARLLAEPGTAVPALILAGGDQGLLELGPQEVLDTDARRALEHRAREVAAELAEAEDHADLGRMERLSVEFDAIVDELQRATGIGGRTRTFAGPGERARTAVHKAIGRALDAIEAADAELGALLRSGVTTGADCTYRPEPGGTIRWSVQDGPRSGVAHRRPTTEIDART